MKNPNKKFELVSQFSPTGDQPQAIGRLTEGVRGGAKEQVLVGVTGSGKTFTMANVIARTQRPTLIISHNKTLAAQLYQEFRDFFPHNAVSYFVSYYDYYQPEAYLPQTDTYIEKETEINEEIDKLRLAATANILTRPDCIVIASVSCIYNIGSPREYGHFVLEMQPGMKVGRDSILKRLIQLQYERNNVGFTRGSFRVRGDVVDIFPAYEDTTIRIVLDDVRVKSLERRDPVTGEKIGAIDSILLFPAKHFMTDPSKHTEVFRTIEDDMERQVALFKKEGKLIEAQRLQQRVTYDLEMIREVGYVNGIENYSRYFDGRSTGSPPYTLLDYFEEAYPHHEWLLFIDESHMTVPQIRGMYNGDRSRKQTLIDFGFRLPAALDNRPLRFDEFLRQAPPTIFVSATPDEWEMERADQVVEQLIRPTGLVDPTITIRPTLHQIEDLTEEIQKRVLGKERVLVTTLTKRTSEDLSQYLEKLGIRVHYLHADILTLKRTDILADLRKGTYDVIVGVNLLREGLDLPEVSLVAILDADKEGFLRSRTSLIQTMGRAARHEGGQVIMYADTITKSMTAAIAEVERRRAVQQTYNKNHGIIPKGITKPIREQLVDRIIEEEVPTDVLPEESTFISLTPLDRETMVKKLRKQMTRASRDLRFEEAAKIRDLITTLEKSM